MDYLIKTIAHAWDLSPAHYWHLRLLSSLMLVPLLGVLYVVLFDRRKAVKVHKLQPHK